jgi:hypothetical protein
MAIRQTFTGGDRKEGRSTTHVTLRREMTAAMRDHNVSISLGEGMIVREGVDIHDGAADLDVMSEVGVGRINTVSRDPTRRLVGVPAPHRHDASRALGFRSGRHRRARSGAGRLLPAERRATRGEPPELHGKGDVSWPPLWNSSLLTVPIVTQSNVAGASQYQ